MKGNGITAGRAGGRHWWRERWIVVAIAAGVLVIVGALIGFMILGRGIRAYRNQIRFLDASWMCAAEHQGTKVVLSGDNHRKLISLLDRSSRGVVHGEPQVTDTVFLTFTKDGVKWEMEISQTDSDCLKLDLVGEDEYHVYISEDNYFETIAELVSPEGKGTPNKAVGAAD